MAEAVERLLYNRTLPTTISCVICNLIFPKLRRVTQRRARVLKRGRDYCPSWRVYGQYVSCVLDNMNNKSLPRVFVIMNQMQMCRRPKYLLLLHLVERMYPLEFLPIGFEVTHGTITLSNDSTLTYFSEILREPPGPSASSHSVSE